MFVTDFYGAVTTAILEEICNWNYWSGMEIVINLENWMVLQLILAYIQIYIIQSNIIAIVKINHRLDWKFQVVPQLKQSPLFRKLFYFVWTSELPRLVVTLKLRRGIDCLSSSLFFVNILLSSVWIPILFPKIKISSSTFWPIMQSPFFRSFFLSITFSILWTDLVLEQVFRMLGYGIETCNPKSTHYFVSLN